MLVFQRELRLQDVGVRACSSGSVWGQGKVMAHWGWEVREGWDDHQECNIYCMSKMGIIVFRLSLFIVSGSACS